MRTRKWLWLLPLWLSCSYAFMFFSLREKGTEPQNKASCGEHFRKRLDLAEPSRGWLKSTWFWLLVLVVLYAVLKLRGEGKRSEGQNPSGLQSCSFRSALRKSHGVSPAQECVFNTLNQLEVDLVKFVSRVRSLKFAMSTSNSLNLQNIDLPVSARNITIYEIHEEDSE
ncbi:PREDICTED: protein FAM209B [Elephantulus edwardii]|uniref:protein FAM209B n=1 Tax=Elephantulus edwardii TaxID=28737 RepID=UPI0003F0C58E|nr:PREDICTED: protein FAM209B [Elephantulus edwardii]